MTPVLGLCEQAAAAAEEEEAPSATHFPLSVPPQHRREARAV